MWLSDLVTGACVNQHGLEVGEVPVKARTEEHLYLTSKAFVLERLISSTPCMSLNGREETSQRESYRKVCISSSPLHAGPDSAVPVLLQHVMIGVALPTCNQVQYV